MTLSLFTPSVISLFQFPLLSPPPSHSPFFLLLLSPFPSPFTSPSIVSCLSFLSSSSLSSHPNISNLFHSTLHPSHILLHSPKSTPPPSLYPNTGCDKNFHKKCAYKIPNNCTRLKTADGISNCTSNCPPRPEEVWSGRPLWIDRTLRSRQYVPHTFFVHTFKKPTQCHHCKKLVSTIKMVECSLAGLHLGGGEEAKRGVHPPPPPCQNLALP